MLIYLSFEPKLETLGSYSSLLYALFFYLFEMKRVMKFLVFAYCVLAFLCCNIRVVQYSLIFVSFQQREREMALRQELHGLQKAARQSEVRFVFQVFTHLRAFF